ncbi:MAG: phasin family protein [Novosphingobium sp.]
MADDAALNKMPEPASDAPVIETVTASVAEPVAVAETAEAPAKIDEPQIEAPAPVIAAPPVLAPKLAPAKVAAPKAAKVKKVAPAAKLAPAAKPAATAAKVTAPKAVAVKAPVRRAYVRKAVTPKAPLEKPASVWKSPAAPRVTNKSIPSTPISSKPISASPIPAIKDTIMSKTTTTAETVATKIKGAFADVQDKAKTAFEKSSASLTEAGAFAKGNVEALVESGKLLSAGAQELGKGYVEEAKTGFETLTADVKELAAVKSPTDFFKLQGEIARRNMDVAVAQASKNTEAMMKMVNEAFAPLSSRINLAVEKINKAA